MSFSNTDTGSKPADPYKAKNAEDVPLKEKIEDLVTFMDANKFAMMTTRVSSSGLLTSRCMALAAKESGGIDLLFHTNTESGKTDSLAGDPHINISFLSSSGEWASIAGDASVETDRELVRKHYSPALKAWLGDLGDKKHDGGPEDPRIGVIRVKARAVTYAISHKSAISRGVEVAKGVVTGNAAQVNSLREITEEELTQWRGVST